MVRWLYDIQLAIEHIKIKLITLYITDDVILLTQNLTFTQHIMNMGDKSWFIHHASQLLRKLAKLTIYNSNQISALYKKNMFIIEVVSWNEIAYSVNQLIYFNGFF